MSIPNSPQDEHVPDATIAVSPLNEEVKDQPLVLPGEAVQEEPYYTFEEEQDAGAVPLATPFGLSQDLPEVAGQSSGEVAVPSLPVHPQKSRGKPRFSLMFIAIIVCVIVILGFLVVGALAQPGSPMQVSNQPAQVHQTPRPQGPAPTQGSTAQPGSGQNRNTPNPQPGNGQNTPNPQQGNGTPSNGVPPQLPTGWAAAGLSTSDAIEAQRVATTFTDREMSLDFRSAGTRTNHSGTFTAAVFLLTPAGQQRFAQNDMRVANNTLWDKVQQERLVQSVVDVQSQIIQFSQVGQQQLAWIDVSFHLWQSKVNGNATPTEGFDTDPATNQPILHHLMVILLRVSPQNGGNTAMGGIGWLVSTYALDLPSGTKVQMVTPA
jgi:hypothetical protein